MYFQLGSEALFILLKRSVGPYSISWSSNYDRSPAVILHGGAPHSEGPGLRVDAVLVSAEDLRVVDTPGDPGPGEALRLAAQHHVAPLARHQRRLGPLLDPRPDGQDVDNHVLVLVARHVGGVARVVGHVLHAQGGDDQGGARLSWSKVAVKNKLWQILGC